MMTYMSSVDPVALAEGLDELDARGLAARLGEIERAIRALHAASVAVIAAADRRQAYAEDGHASVRGWVKASLRIANVDVTARVRTAKLITAFPQFGTALADGRLGVGQVGELARLHANPRCGDEIGTVADTLLEHATTLPFETFAKVTRHFERLADADGAHRTHEQIDRARSADITTVDDTTYVSARVGAAQGARLREVFDAFVRAEFAADWDAVRAQLGDDATPGDMARTEQQRRADALVAIFDAAACAGTTSGERVPVVNIVIDQPVFEAQLAAVVADRDPVFDVDDVVHTRCCTTSGIPLDPRDAVAAAVVGHVRRVVVGADAVIIDLGRRSRLFTGSAREAARLQAALDGDGTCTWPGCTRRHCQIDHNDEWVADLGCTDVRNSSPKCGRHNRWKSRGYHTWRDPTGVWHTQRPDGTEITPT
jgi:hypothetical protein